jgi:NAD(P)-dependent dehydrogenase (short-subunit alcohol dehydrogenase family)
MTKRFENRVALVTGGSLGIGRATAIAFAAEGAKVVVANRGIEEGEETVKIIKENGGEAIFVQTDVSSSSDVEALVKKTIDTYGRLDCAFNNAGISGSMRPMIDLKEEDWDRVLDINLKGIWLCMKYEIPFMLEQGGGSIVNMSSVLGLGATTLGLSAYIASKHGIIGLTKAAALEYAQKGIRINAVCPGYIHTPMIDAAASRIPGFYNQIAQLHPVGRIGAPEEIAEAVLWLCSDASSFVTAHSLVIDGGLVAQ